MNVQILEIKKVPVNNSGTINSQGKNFSNQTEFVYDKYFRRKAFFRHLLHDSKFRKGVLTVVAVVLTLFTPLVLALIPLMRILI